MREKVKLKNALFYLILFTWSICAHAATVNVKVTGSAVYSPKNPAISVTSDRRLHAVWQDIDTSTNKWEIYYSASDSGEIWSTAKIISDSDAYDSTLPSIASYGGKLYVVWQDMSYNSHNEIYVRESADGGTTFNPKVAVSTLDNSISARPHIDVNNSGTVCVVWEDSKEGHQEIYYAVSYDSAATFTEAILSHLDSNNSNAPRVCSTSDGTFHVVWVDGKEIYYNNTQTPNSAISEVNLSNNGYASTNPDITAIGTNLHVVWQDYSDFNWNIYYKVKTINGWSDTIKQLISNPGTSQYPSITADSTKNLHVVWQDEYDGNAEIYYQKHIYSKTSTEWETYVKLTDNDSVDSLHPVAIASDDSGVDNGVHVVWEYNTHIYYTNIPTGGISGNNPTLATTDPLYPEDGGTNAPITTKISIKFNKPMLQSSIISPTTMRVFEGTKQGTTWVYTTEVNGTRSYSSADYKAIFTPQYSLKNDNKYKVSVTSEATDIDGNRFLGQVWYFTTENGLQPVGDYDLTITEAYSYPNPYQGTGDIRFRYTISRNSLSSVESLEIRIFNFNGQIVRAISGDAVGTTSETSWDVTDESGYELPNGLYIFKIIAKTTAGEESTKTGKIMIVR